VKEGDEDSLIFDSIQEPVPEEEGLTNGRIIQFRNDPTALGEGGQTGCGV